MKKPSLSFHRLPLNNKKQLKVWIHKIGRKNLPVNSNTRVCSEHFVNSAGRRLRKDEFPSRNLPILPTSVILPVKRKSPKKRSKHVGDRSGSDEEGEPAPVQDYDCDQCCSTELTVADIKCMEERIEEMKEELRELKHENAALKFSLANIADNDKKVSFYTGFPTYAALMACFKFLGPAVNQLIYWNSKLDDTCETKRKGRPRTLAPIEEFFVVLVRLRLGLLEQDLADRFGLSCATISRIFTTWINFMYLKLKEIPLWPPRDIVQANMPKCFRNLYPTTRVIIDATEVYIEKPSLPDLQQMTFSNYKNNNTFKGLIGISPSGAITFVSSLFSGSISDKELTRQSGLLALLEKGDSIMADRGFDIEADLIPLGVKLNIPPFLKGKSQLSENEMVATRRIASVRIHVERAMERIKNYHIFDKDIPSSSTDLADQIFFVCSVLSNFWPPLCE